MTENVKKLNELASADEALAKRLTEAQDKEALTAIAAEAGITLTEADFEAIEAQRKRVILAQGSEKLSDDELDAVAGGDVCVCVAGGGGVYKKGEYKKSSLYTGEDLTCACVISGYGYYKYQSSFTDNKAFGGEGMRCMCLAGGGGESVIA